MEIARRCNLTLQLGKSQLPAFPTPNKESLQDYLRARTLAGLEARLGHLFADTAERAAQLPRYRARLDFEIETIIQMGFPGYFLIVADFINWAKSTCIPKAKGTF